MIEFCDDPQTLWDKLESGHWDWLGVRKSKLSVTFVLGRPPTSRGMVVRATGTVRYPGDPIHDDTYRVTVQQPADDRVSSTHYGSAEAARIAFRDKVSELGAPTGDSGLFRVRLYVERQLVDEELVVRASPNLV